VTVAEIGSRLRVDEVQVVLDDGRRILGPVSLACAPGSLTAVLGPSGSGKSTLLRTMGGLLEPSEGTVQLGKAPATHQVEALGYVPQRETVHERLTVEEAFGYAAQLRLEAGAGVGATVERVLDELDLGPQRHTWIRNLSGGERRGTACGLELVGDPAVLLLDEPTSGLDPVLERRLMLMFRRLADSGRAVVVATHTSSSLDLCDAVLVLAPDGTTAFSGDPAAARAHLEQSVRGGEARLAEHHASRTVETAHGARPRTAARRRRFSLEFGTLLARYARTMVRDRRTLAALLGQAPLIGLLIAIPFGSVSLSGSSAAPADLMQVVFLLMTASIWLGVTGAAREVVKERGILEREFDVGLRLDAYVLAKAMALFVLSAAQVLLVMVVVVALRLGGQSPAAIFELFGLAVAVAWTSVALGLAVSAAARSVDQATGVVPLLLIPQLLFAGALIPLARMPRAVEALAELSYGRWAFAGMGSAAGLQGQFQASGDAASALGLDPTFFALTPGAAVIVLAAFALFWLFCAAALLNRRVAPEGG
jgi:ABC-type multidrug transport system ATPase subunit/ABC-type multidrug transport system permease subunit